MARTPSTIAGALVLTAFACALSDRPEFDGERSDASAPELPSIDAGDSGCTTGGLVCSRDLHSVLDACTEAVVEECPPEMGCAGGHCVPACTSAETNKGTVGCTFWTVPSSGEVFNEQAGGCFAASITNTWNLPVHIEAEYEGAPLDISRSTFIPRVTGTTIEYEPLTGPLPPREVALVFLSQAEDVGPNVIRCPKPVAVAKNPLPPRTGRAHAFRLSTDLPVSAYSVFPYGGASSAISAATVLLPISSWGKNYVMVDAWDVQDVPLQPGLGFPESQGAMQIVAAEDDTRVSIGGEPGATGGSAATTEVTLARGELFQVLQRRTFAGRPIEASKPVAVFGGADCFNVPIGTLACDSAQQQIPPLSAWGKEYAAVRYRNRTDLYLGEGAAVDNEPVPWRIVGAANDTLLEYEPKRPANAPTKIGVGEAKTFWSQEPFVVRSQDADHPFYLAGYMTGAASDGAQRIGDPDFVNVIPTDQYLDSYVFFADVTYQFTTLTVVRRNDGHGFANVTLDCAGVLSGWKKLDGSPADGTGRFEYTYVDLLRHWSPQPYRDGGMCGSGRHEMQSDGPFAVTVWGLAPYDSYAYPGGAGVRPLTAVHVPVK
jgi:IgGFc binding protein